MNTKELACMLTKHRVPGEGLVIETDKMACPVAVILHLSTP